MKKEITDIAHVLREIPSNFTPPAFKSMTSTYDGSTIPEVKLDPAKVLITLSIISVRDGADRNNALVGGCMTNISDDPETIMVAIGKARFSHHMVRENPNLVINLFNQKNGKEYQVFGSMSGRSLDKFTAANVKWQDGDVVNAPVLTDCPVNLECKVIGYGESQTHGFFYCKVEKVHLDDTYINESGAIDWDNMHLIIG